jgi:hypothetical protein
MYKVAYMTSAATFHVGARRVDLLFSRYWGEAGAGPRWGKAAEMKGRGWRGIQCLCLVGNVSAQILNRLVDLEIWARQLPNDLNAFSEFQRQQVRIAFLCSVL